MYSPSLIRQLLQEKVDQLLEFRYKRVVRHGQIVRKAVSKNGFKIVRVKGGRTKIKRMSPTEKRNRHLALIRTWKIGHQARVVKEKRMLKRSLIRRKAVFGG